jgi:hypothetical protein
MTNEGNGGRQFLCPSCSGKRVAPKHDLRDAVLPGLLPE